MIGLLRFVLAVLASPLKSKLRLQAENAVLRHQLIVLRRRLHGRVRLTNNDRWFFIQLYRWFPSILKGSRCQAGLWLGKRKPADFGPKDSTTSSLPLIRGTPSHCPNEAFGYEY